MGVVAWCSISAHASLCFGAATPTATRTSPSSPRHRTKIHLEPRCRSWRFECRAGNSGAERDGVDWASSPTASPYQILGVDPAGCSQAELKAAFRARVKEFHPDLSKDKRQAETLIKRVIKAYENKSNRANKKSEKKLRHSRNYEDQAGSRSQILAREEEMQEAYLYIGFLASRPGTDPFEEPECEAYDLFINEFQCFGKGCPYSCVKTAPEAFAFCVENGTAHVISQDHGNDYLVQLAVGQCPRRCIHYVTPAQRAVLENILQSALNTPFDLTETLLLDSLISKAKFENNRYQKPKRKPKISTEYVDWI
ncbi:hypothetical protein ZIOFF_009602 [Zingiber officinale]|uniref:J domain-containing protein n=1 Tax=Zingiber officinale TaxID=94328 RepID=A0A8J5HFT9_ZINOF|nr:hypothetical protein ZIOFF_009602 [Zingiber officinale]